MTTGRSWNIEASFRDGVEAITVGARYRRALGAAATAVGADLVMPSLFSRMAVEQCYSGYRDPIRRSGLQRSAKISG